MPSSANIFRSSHILRLIFLMLLSQFSSVGATSFAQEEVKQVEINGDQVEFSMKENKVVAQGHVSIVRSDVSLFCDHLEFFRDTKVAIAEGHVILKRKEGLIIGDRMTFNYNTMTGDFTNAKVTAKPYYGTAGKISKVGENHIVMNQGYLTTCDLAEPHFRFLTRKVDLYPQDKVIARGDTLVVGRLPLLYIPKFTQDLQEKKPMFIIIPGYKKGWGAFALSQWRYHLSDDVSGVLHFDYRTLRGFAEGADLNYKTDNFGNGIVRTYYISEKDPGKGVFPWEANNTVATGQDRYRAEWRHKWDIDPQTEAIWQYYKISDANFLKDYFPREYDQDINPNTYFLLSHELPAGVLSFQAEPRINHFVGGVERLPEISYDLANHRLGSTGFYLQSSSVFSDLALDQAAPSTARAKTIRVDTKNQLSYPFKLSFFELRPFAGTEDTYYSRTKDPTQRDVVRTVFMTGSDVSTRFYRIYNVKTNIWGLDIDRLRHVINPSVAYQYTHDPSFSSTQLDQYDAAIDGLTRSHMLTFSLENKLQTKRGGSNVDLVRALVTSDFKLKEDLGPGGINNVKTNFEIKPYSWLSFYTDSTYDTINKQMQSQNFDIYINDDKSDWYIRLGQRYAVDVDNLFTTEFGFTLNPKWKFMTYQQYELKTGKMKEQQYGFRRDLHCWLMDINFDHKQDGGNEIWMVFTLKDFPRLGFDFRSSFSPRRPGSQTSQ